MTVYVLLVDDVNRGPLVWTYSTEKRACAELAEYFESATKPDEDVDELVAQNCAESPAARYGYLAHAGIQDRFDGWVMRKTVDPED